MFCHLFGVIKVHYPVYFVPHGPHVGRYAVCFHYTLFIKLTKWFRARPILSQPVSMLLWEHRREGCNLDGQISESWSVSLICIYVALMWGPLTKHLPCPFPGLPSEQPCPRAPRPARRWRRASPTARQARSRRAPGRTCSPCRGPAAGVWT